MVQYQISLQHRKQLIATHPCFSELSADELDIFSQLCIEKTISAKTIIVRENDIVDSIYFIVSGMAEVQKTVVNDKQQTEMIPLATLHPKEVIGLSDTGFYSITGKRTATVIARSEMILLRLDVAALYEFLKSHERVNKMMRDNAELIMRMNLIKHVAPFERLTPDNIQWLASQVTSQKFLTGEDIFHKGDHGDQCYLIRSGKIKIFIPNKEGTESRIAILKASQVFGEASILMDAPRNASARAVKDCELLALNRDALLTVVKKETDVASSLMILLKSRSRPKWMPHIEVHTYQTDDQELIVTLRDADNNLYYRLTQEGLFIWQMLNGRNTLRDISLAFNQRYGLFDPGMISTFILDLEMSGFVEKTLSHWQNKREENGWFQKAITGLRYYMEASVSFGQVDHGLTKAYQQWAYLFFSYPFQLAYALLSVLGIFTFFYRYSEYIEFLRKTNYSSGLLILALFFGIATTLLHELAHAFATKAFGHKVHCFGVGWYWYGPVAICDTSDMWLSPKWPRIVVDLAGIYLDFVLAGIAAIMALFFIDYSTIALFFWLFALVKYLAIFSNLDPMMELDGYYTLMDWLGKDNLRQSAILFLAEEFPKNWKNPTLLWRDYKKEIIYWLVCLIYLIFAVILPYLILNIMLYGLLGVQNPYVALIGPIVVLFFSGLSIWYETKKVKA